MFKRLISALSAAVMLLSAIPVSAMEIRGNVEEGTADYTGIWELTSEYLPDTIEIYQNNDDTLSSSSFSPTNTAKMSLSLYRDDETPETFSGTFSSRYDGSYLSGKLTMTFSNDTAECVWTDTWGVISEDFSEEFTAKRTQNFLTGPEFNPLPTAEELGVPYGLSMDCTSDNIIDINYVNTPAAVTLYSNISKGEFYYPANGNVNRYGLTNLTPCIQYDIRIDGGEWQYTEEWDSTTDLSDFAAATEPYIGNLYNSNHDFLDFRYDDTPEYLLFTENNALISFTNEEGDTVCNFDYANHTLEVRARYLYEYDDPETDETVYVIGKWSETSKELYDYDNNIAAELPTQIETPVIKNVTATYDKFYPYLTFEVYPSYELLKAASQRNCGLRLCVQASLYDETKAAWDDYVEIGSQYLFYNNVTSAGLLNECQEFSIYDQSEFYARPESQFRFRAYYKLDGYNWQDEVSSEMSDPFEMTIDEVKAYPINVTLDGYGSVYVNGTHTGKNVEVVMPEEDYYEDDEEYYDDLPEITLPEDITLPEGYDDITLPDITLPELPEETTEEETTQPTLKEMTCYINENDNCELSFYPLEPTYEIDKIFLDNVDITAEVLAGYESNYEYEYIISGVTGPHDLLVLYKPTGIESYDITINCGEHGSTYPESYYSIFDGKDFFMDIYPDENYTIDTLTINNVTYVTRDTVLPIDVDTIEGVDVLYCSEGGLSLYNVTEDKVIDITFRSTEPVVDKFGTVNITFDETQGYVNGNSTKKYDILVGETDSFLISPFLLYAIDTVTIDGVDKTASLVDNTFDISISEEGETHNVDIKFKKLPSNVLTVSCSEVGGDYSFSGDYVHDFFSSTYEFLTGASTTLEVVPTVGYDIESVSINGTPVELALNRYLISNISADMKIDIVFKIKTFTITATYNDSFDSCVLSPSGKVKVEYDKDQTFKLTIPEKGFFIESIEVDGVMLDTIVTEYTFKNVQENHTIDVWFGAEQIDVNVQVVSGDKIHSENKVTCDYSTILTYDTASTDLIPAGYRFSEAYLQIGEIMTPITLDGTVIRHQATDNATIVINVVEAIPVTMTLKVICNGEEVSSIPKSYTSGTVVSFDVTSSIIPVGYKFLNAYINSEDNPVTITDNTFTVEAAADTVIYFNVEKLDAKIIYGDLNGDTKVTIADLNILVKYVAEFLTLTDEQMLAADVNVDGKVNIADLNKMVKYIADFDVILGTK